MSDKLSYEQFVTLTPPRSEHKIRELVHKYLIEIFEVRPGKGINWQKVEYQLALFTGQELSKGTLRTRHQNFHRKEGQNAYFMGWLFWLYVDCDDLFARLEDQEHPSHLEEDERAFREDCNAVADKIFGELWGTSVEDRYRDFGPKGTNWKSKSKIIDNVTHELGLRRELIESLAFHFNHNNPDASDQEMIQFIKDKAVEGQSLQNRLAGLAEAERRLAEALQMVIMHLQWGQFNEAIQVLEQLESSIENLTVEDRYKKLADVKSAQGLISLIANECETALSYYDAATQIAQDEDLSFAAEVRDACGIIMLTHCARYREENLLLANDFIAKNQEYYLESLMIDKYINVLCVRFDIISSSLDHISKSQAVELYNCIMGELNNVIPLINKTKTPDQWRMAKFLEILIVQSISEQSLGEISLGDLSVLLTHCETLIEEIDRSDEHFNILGLKYYLAILRYEYVKKKGIPENKEDLLHAMSLLDDVLKDPEVHKIPPLGAEILSTTGEIFYDLTSAYSSVLGFELLDRSIFAQGTAVALYDQLQMHQDRSTALNRLGNALIAKSRCHVHEEGMLLLARAQKCFKATAPPWGKDVQPGNWAIAHTNLARASVQLSYRTSGQDRSWHLLEAQALYEECLAIRKDLDQPFQAATVRLNLSSLYRLISETFIGEKAAQYLIKSFWSVKSNIRLYNNSENSKEIANANSNMAITLRSISLICRGRRSIYFARQSVNYHLKAAEKYKDASLFDDLARVCNNISISQCHLGLLIKERESEELFKRAQVNCENALKFRTKEMDPQSWAVTKHNIALALACLCWHVASDAVADKSKEVESAILEALEIRTQENFPYDWIMSQNLYANILRWKCESCILEEREQFAAKAKKVYAAVTEFTAVNDTPKEWAIATAGLGACMVILSELKEVKSLYEEGQELFNSCWETLSSTAAQYEIEDFRRYKIE